MGKSAQFDCNRIKQWSTGGNVLKSSEYAGAMSGMTHGTFDSNFDHLPFHLREPYTRRAHMPCSDFDSSMYSYSERCLDLLSEDSWESFCQEIEQEIEETISQPASPTLHPNVPTTYPSTWEPTLEYVSVPSPLEATFSEEYVDWHRDLQTLQQCYIFISIGDTNRNNILTETEYVTFLNRLSDNKFAGLEFDDLPQRFRGYFDEVSAVGGIDVSGSKPGQTPTTSQAEFLEGFCEDSKELLLATDAPADQPVGPPTASCDGTIDKQQCYIDMSIADRNRDSFLVESEYVRLVNRISDNEYDGSAFDDLPASIRGNFFNLADGGSIDVYGSKPGQSASQDQEEFLLRVCCETDFAIQNPDAPTVSPPPGGEPTAAPGGPDCGVTLSRQKCNIFLSIADLSKDDFLNEVEYVRFLDRLSGTGAYSGVAFSDLTGPLVANFNKFAGVGGQIDVFGAKPGQTSLPTQDEFIGALCCETDLLVQGITPAPVAPSTLPPTNAPISPPPTTTPGTPTSEPSISPSSLIVPTVAPFPTPAPVDGEIEIFNAFIIVNTVGITAGQLGNGANRNGLESAYDAFVRGSVDAILQEEAVSSSLRRQRKLIVSFFTGSPAIYRISDSECPDQVGNDQCQICYARFVVDVQNESVIEIMEKYTSTTQKDIDSGLLQNALTREDPSSPLKILNATFPVRDPNEVPTTSPVSEAPATAPPAPPADESSSNVGAIVGGVFGAIFICLFFVFVGWYSKKRDKAKNGKKTEDDDNSIGDGEDKVQGNIVGPSSSQQLSFTNFFDTIKSRFGTSKGKGGDLNAEEGEGKDDDDSDREDNEFGGFGAEVGNTFGEPGEKTGKKEKEKKNKFGFGKKNKQEEEQPDAFGLETVFSDGGSKHDIGFGNYDFEDPSSGDDENNNEDDEEVGSKEDRFESNMSPAWGTSETGFGTSWGAGGSNDLGSDFLVSKTFTTNNVNNDDNVENDEEGEDEGEDDEGANTGSSYQSSDDDTYETSADERRFPSDSFSGSSNHDMDDASSADNSAPETQELGGDNWDETEQDANSLGSQSADDDEQSNQADSYDGSSQSDSEGMTNSTATSNSEERVKRAEYRAQVEALVRLVLPEESNKVSEMMDQFRGREAELVSTLQNMQERSATQRARAAVHKSKTRPSREETRAGGSYAGADNIVGGASEGSAAGTAAIAAASLPIPAGGFDEGLPQDDNDGNGFGEEDAFESSDDGGSLYSDQESGDDEGSYYSESKDDTFEGGDDHIDPEDSYYSGDDPGSRGSESRSFDDRSGESGSFAEESHTGGSFTNAGQSQGGYSDSFDEEGQSFADESGYGSQEESDGFEADSFHEDVPDNDESSEGQDGDDGSEEVVSLSQDTEQSFVWN